MMRQLTRLFEPIKIDSMELKNRIKMPALSLRYARDMKVTDRLKNFYAERAKGGAALIGIACSPTRLEISEAGDELVAIYDDRFIPGLRELADICHRYGAKIYAQAGVGYSWTFGDGPVELVSPSGVTTSGRPRPPFRIGTPKNAAPTRAVTVDEIHQVVDAFGEAARRAREADFDAFECGVAGGYFISQFFSPRTNKRTDEYGESLENRARIFIDIVNSIKKRAGEDYPILFRLSASDFLDGGYTIEDTKVLAQLAEKAGVNAFDGMYGWHESPVPAVQNSVAQGHWVYVAEELKKAVSVPVGAGTRISDPLFAEQIIAEGRADFVYMARPLIADPELPNLAFEGRLDDIRPCIACSHCLDSMMDGPVACTVNPRAGREGEYTVEPTEKAKKVAVIGGGPGGMQAAIIASRRGHEVTLYEKGDRLGGQMLIASLTPYKDYVAKFSQYLTRQVKESQVKVRLGQAISFESISESKLDIVIVTTGACPIIPDIAGVDGENVVLAVDVLTGCKEVSQTVVIVGGGLVGCETAEFLAQRGKQVTILEMLDRIGNDIGPSTRWVILGRLRKTGVRIEVNVTVTGITDKGVKGLKAGSSEFFKGDSVIIAVGAKANKALVEALEGKMPMLYSAGDCVEPRGIVNAIREGFKIASEI